MHHAAAAGLLYSVIVFCLGFALGVMRTRLVAPEIGELQAVVFEAPFMLALSWSVCGWVLEKIPVAPGGGRRLLVAATAFGLLLVAEAALAVTLAGESLTEHLRGYRKPSAMVGLSAQVAFACFPLVRRRKIRPERSAHGETNSAARPLARVWSEPHSDDR